MNKKQRLDFLIEEADAKEHEHREVTGKIGLADEYRQDKELLMELRKMWRKNKALEGSE